jgi:hypothetical protein
MDKKKNKASFKNKLISCFKSNKPIHNTSHKTNNVKLSQSKNIPTLRQFQKREDEERLDLISQFSFYIQINNQF